jgi:hypothetical protein
MKPILDWTKSKAEAYTPGAAPKGTLPAPFSFRLQQWPNTAAREYARQVGLDRIDSKHW